MKGVLKGDRVQIKDEKTASKLQQRGFGTRKEDVLDLPVIEALYLLEKGTIMVKEGKKTLGFDDLFDRIKEDGLHGKYQVYSDLRNRGYIAKSGFKFGAHFRVYGRGEGIDSHSKFLVHVQTEDSVLSFPEVSRAVRLAQGVKKDMMFAVIDGEGDITYYKVERITP